MKFKPTSEIQPRPKPKTPKKKPPRVYKLSKLKKKRKFSEMRADDEEQQWEYNRDLAKQNYPIVERPNKKSNKNNKPLDFKPIDESLYPIQPQQINQSNDNANTEFIPANNPIYNHLTKNASTQSNTNTNVQTRPINQQQLENDYPGLSNRQGKHSNNNDNQEYEPPNPDEAKKNYPIVERGNEPPMKIESQSVRRGARKAMDKLDVTTNAILQNQANFKNKGPKETKMSENNPDVTPAANRDELRRARQQFQDYDNSDLILENQLKDEREKEKNNDDQPADKKTLRKLSQKSRKKPKVKNNNKDNKTKLKSHKDRISDQYNKRKEAKTGNKKLSKHNAKTRKKNKQNKSRKNTKRKSKNKQNDNPGDDVIAENEEWLRQHNAKYAQERKNVKTIATSKRYYKNTARNAAINKMESESSQVLGDYNRQTAPFISQNPSTNVQDVVANARNRNVRSQVNIPESAPEMVNQPRPEHPGTLAENTVNVPISAIMNDLGGGIMKGKGKKKIKGKAKSKK